MGCLLGIIQLTLDHVSPATRLLEKRRQMFEVQEALDAQKQEFARREETFRLREDAFRKKDVEFQQNVIKFDKFTQENTSKFKRANKRAEDEESQRLAKEVEIERLKKVLAKQQQDRVEMEARVENLRKYQEFLHHVVDTIQMNTPKSKTCSTAIRLYKMRTKTLAEIRMIQSPHLRIPSMNLLGSSKSMKMRI